MASDTSTNVLLITGANSGVGYYAAKAFFESDKPYHVLAAARSQQKAEDAVASIKKECPESKNKIEPIVIDVTDDTTIESAFEHVKTSIGRLDTLINNAGATWDLDFLAGKVSLREWFNKAYDCNVTGAHAMSWTFMPLLLKSSDPRLLFIYGLSQITEAYAGKFDPIPDLPAGWPKKMDFETIGYRCSKVALSMLMLYYYKILQADGVKVWSVAPGFLATNLGGIPDKVAEMGGGHPSEGAKVYKEVVEGKRDHQVGRVIGKNGEISL